MQYIGHPLINDFVYGNAKTNEYGQYLHAQTLGFTHPRTKEWMEFESFLPQEFTDYIKNKRTE
jgi:23S rRNA pseudouridine1911/1915/1917 synthase